MPCRQVMIPLATGGVGARSSSRAPSWGALFSHPAVWAIILNNFTFHYAFYVVMNWLPLYFEQVRGACCSPHGLLHASRASALLRKPACRASCKKTCERHVSAQQRASE